MAKPRKGQMIYFTVEGADAHRHVMGAEPPTDDQGRPVLGEVTGSEGNVIHVQQPNGMPDCFLWNPGGEPNRHLDWKDK